MAGLLCSIAAPVCNTGVIIPGVTPVYIFDYLILLNLMIISITMIFSDILHDSKIEPLYLENL